MPEFDFESLERFLDQERLQVVVASRPSPSADWRTRRLEVVGNLHVEIRGVVQRSLKQLRRREEERYIEGWSPEPGRYYLASAEDADGPLVQALLDSYSAPSERADLPVEGLAGESHTGDDEWFKARVLGLVARRVGDGAPSTDLLIVRAQNPVIEMVPGMVTAVIRGKRLEEERRLFAYDGRIDVLVWKGELLVNNPNVLENLLRSEERLVAELDEAVAAFEETQLVDGLDRIKSTAMKDSNFARGLRRVHKAGYLDGLQGTAIRQAVASWGHDTISLDERDKVVFESSARWDFLRLIDDGYLTSDLTGRRYEVNSKRGWNRVEVTGIERDESGAIAAVTGPGAWSPRAVGEVLQDLDRGRAVYFLSRDQPSPVRLRRKILPRPTLWAGPDEDNLLERLG